MRLTVLAYHRVADPADPGFRGYAGNASASPEAFADQAAWIARNCTPVTLRDVADTLDGEELPERATLVTFDDGYRDNLDVALPLLERHSIPAAVFLATDHIGSADPFWWDRAAWLIETAVRHPNSLPLLPQVGWRHGGRAITTRWVRAAKRVSHRELWDALTALEEVTGGSPPDVGFRDQHLTWDHVRAMQERGVTFGAHTCSHPILANLDPAEVRRQVGGSIERVRAETGRPVLGFAYPNGLPGDFGPEAVQSVADAGVPLGFTLFPGPARRRELVREPLKIRRVYIHHRDDDSVFRAKVSGLSRLVR